MSLLQRIKDDQLAARKARDTLKATLLTTLIGEATTVKPDGSRGGSDAEVTALIKKFIKNTNEVLKALGSIEGGAAMQPLAELAILETYLPKQLSEAELTAAVAEIVGHFREKTNPVTMGMVMGALKAGFEGQYDGKMASAVVKAAVA